MNGGLAQAGASTTHAGDLGELLDTAVREAVSCANAGLLVSAEKAAHQAQILSTTLRDDRSQACSFFAWGVIHHGQDDFPKALQLFSTAEPLADVSNDKKLHSAILIASGRAHYALGNLSHTLDSFYSALLMAQELGEDVTAVHAYCGLAQVFSRLEDYNHAVAFARRALIMARPREDTETIAHALIALGTVSAREHERTTRSGVQSYKIGQEALAWFNEATPLVSRLENRRLHARLVIATASAALQLGEYEQAIQLVTEFLDGGTEQVSPVQVALLHSTLGEARLREGRPADAITLVTKALRIVERHGAAQTVRTLNHILAQACEQVDDHAGALAHHKAFYEIEHRIRNASTREHAALTAIRLESHEIKMEANRLRRANNNLARTIHSLQTEAARLDDEARRDGLTGLANRHAFDEWLVELFTESLELSSLALFDVDNFKRINDCFSHAIGDDVLRIIARLLSQCIRYSDLLARYGGEEFAVIFPGTSLNEAASVCDRVRQEINQNDWSTIHPDLAVTISAGVSAEACAAQALAIADKRLYIAKRTGRNRTIAG